MRSTVLFFVLLAGGFLHAAEPADPAFPLWDGHESVQEYARRTNLQPDKTVDLGNNVKMDLVLIPAGQFIMGTPEPTPVDEKKFQNQIWIGAAVMIGGIAVLLGLFAVIGVKAFLDRRRPKFSLLLLLAMTIVAGIGLMGGQHWWHSAKQLEAALDDYALEKGNYNLAEGNEKPGHKVTITHPFYMGKFPVTQEQFQQVMAFNPSASIAATNPVEQLPWNTAYDFCRRLGKAERQTVRLPTEAEWEYACRAGTSYYSGDAESDLARVAWYWGNSGRKTHPVGEKDPNAFGLYDMLGNVWQYCEDWYSADYYATSPEKDPAGPLKGEPHKDDMVMRGGSMNTYRNYTRSRCRRSAAPNWGSSDNGFRVVLELPR